MHGAQPQKHLQVCNTGDHFRSGPINYRDKYSVNHKSYHVFQVPDEAQWDGSDILRLDHPFIGHTFVTQRWVETVPESKYDGITCVPIAEMLRVRESFIRTYHRQTTCE